RPREQVELHRPGRRSDSCEQTLRLCVGGLPPPIVQASVSACRALFYSRCQTAPDRSPDERSDIRDPSRGRDRPACRFAHAGYELVSLIFICISLCFFLFLSSIPARGGRSADRRPDAASASGCVHDRTRALTFFRGESPAPERPDAAPLGAPS